MNVYIFKQCVKITLPIFFGYFAVGVPYGIIVVNSGYPWYFAPLMSIIMYTGAGQYLGIALFAAGTNILEILLAEFLVNIRHIVYGLSLISRYKAMGKWKYIMVYALSDETYALLSSLELPKNAEAGPFYAAIALLDFFYWLVSSTVGALACSLIVKYNMAHWLEGVDFALTALFVVILVEQIKKTKDFLPPIVGILSCALTLVLCKVGLLPQNNIILVATIVGILAIMLFRGRRKV